MSHAVLHYVAKRFYVLPDDLVGRSRFSHISKARTIACYLMRKKHGMSYTMIGNFLGGRDHTTALHLTNRAEWFINDSPLIKRWVSDYLEGPRLPPPVDKFVPFDRPPRPTRETMRTDQGLLRARIDWAEFRSGVL